MQKNYLERYVDKLWRQLSDVVHGAVVYMDNGTAECLHWKGGLQFFLECGAHAVKRFEESEGSSGYWDEVVFILSGPVVGENVDILRSILTKGQFIKSTLVTPDPSRGLHQENARLSIKERMLEWMGSKKLEAVVMCLPVFVACITQNFFAMPPFSQLFPPLDTSPVVTGPSKNEAQPNFFASTADELFIKALSFSLDSMLTDMAMKEDIFIWGQLSRALGMDVLKLPGFKNRRKNNSGQRASLLLLDRTLDLSPCLTHQCDCIFDSVVRALPQLAGHECCDVAVDMTPLLYPDVKNQNSANLGISPGCLSGQGNTSVLNAMISLKTKDCLMEINRQLVSAGNQHDVGLKVSAGRITPESLLQKVQAFSNNPASIWECQELLQQTLAVVECLNSRMHEKESLMLSTERLLVQNLVASEEGPTRNLLHIMASLKERNITLEDILILLFHLSSVCDDSLWKNDDEVKLQGALAEAIFQDLENLPPFLKNLIGDVSQESNVLSGVSLIFKKLKAIKKGRQHFKKYRSILRNENPALPATFCSVFQQLLTDVLDRSRPDIPDLQCISTGITDMLKSGLGLFMNVQKPHPQDNPVLIIIILGGVTGSEVKALKDIVAATPKAPQLIMGTTRICKPPDILDCVFKV